jgi:hypothetical protein
MYQCKLKIDGNNRELTLTDGLSMKDLSELLNKLAICLKNKGATFYLTSIEDNCQMPIIDTKNEEDVDDFNSLHDKLENFPFERLPKEYRDYGNSLNKLLFKNNMHITTINSKNETSFKLTSINKAKTKKFYYTIKTLTGKIVSIYGKNEKYPSIAFRSFDDKDYTIYITQEQEKNIGQFYKEKTVKIKSKFRIDIETKRHIYGDMINLEIKSTVPFFDQLDILNKSNISFFDDIDDSADFIKQLRYE